MILVPRILEPLLRNGFDFIAWTLNCVINKLFLFALTSIKKAYPKSVVPIIKHMI